MNFHPDVFEIGDDYFAIPTSFKDFNGPTPVLEQSHGHPLIPPSFVNLGDNYETSCRILALRIHRDDWTVPVTVYRETELTLGNKEFLVLNPHEADNKLDKELERLSDELPLDGLRGYFNEEAWKADLALEGRGRWLASYDHLEQQQEVVPGTYFIYRQK